MLIMSLHALSMEQVRSVENCDPRTSLLGTVGRWVSSKPFSPAVLVYTASQSSLGITRDNTPSADFWPTSLASLHSSLPRLPVWHKLFALQFSQYLLLSFQMPAYYFLALRTFNSCDLGLSKCISKKTKQQNTVFILLLLERWCYIYNINFAYSSDTWIRKCMWKGFSRRFEGYLYGFQD